MSLDGTHLLRADRLAFQKRVVAAPGRLGDLEAAALPAARRGGVGEGRHGFRSSGADGL